MIKIDTIFNLAARLRLPWGDARDEGGLNPDDNVGARRGDVAETEIAHGARDDSQQLPKSGIGEYVALSNEKVAVEDNESKYFRRASIVYFIRE